MSSQHGFISEGLAANAQLREQFERLRVAIYATRNSWVQLAASR